MIINNINNSTSGLLSSLKTQTSGLQQSTEKLSSGYRVNTAADDAVNLAISEKLLAQIAGQSKAMDNIQDGISFANVGDGALNEVHSMLNRMQELAVQGSNGIMNNDQRAILQNEMNSLLDEIDRIAQGTNFNGKNLLDGSLDPNAGGKAMEFQVGDTANGFDSIQLEIESSTSEALGLGNISLGSASDSMAALDSIKSAINMVNSNRGTLGATENRLNHAYSSLGVANENTMASNSRIKDADMAKEWMNFTKENLLSQTRNSMVAQSNVHAMQILQLLS